MASKVCKLFLLDDLVASRILLMSIKRTTGVIIKVTDYGESDKIITLYCPVEGKFSVIAKGAKRSKKRFMNKLELFTHLDIQYNNRYTLPIIDQAELENIFPNLRTSFQRYAAAELICELLLHWAHENDGDIEIYKAMLHTFYALNTPATQIKKTLVLFLIHMYSRLGYQPNMAACLKCGTLNYDAAPFLFQSGTGAFICSRCGPVPSHSIPLSISTVKLIGQAQKLPFSKTVRLKFPEESVKQALNLFHKYDNFLLDRELNSWKFLDRK